MYKYNRRKYYKKKYPKRRRYIPYLRMFDYQYAASMQSMGPGSTTKNFERIVTINANTNIRQPLSSLVGDDDYDGCCRGYRYVKILGICITQNAINLTNEQDNVYVRIAWSENYEEEVDIEKDDCSKILPNIGRKRFMFKPPNAQITLSEINSKTINPSEFCATEHLLDQLNESYKIPGSIELYNATTQQRKVRVTLRLVFRGSKVLDKENEAKRLLMRKGYKFENMENNENDKINKNEEESEEEEDEIDDEELSKWEN